MLCDGGGDEPDFTALPQPAANTATSARTVTGSRQREVIGDSMFAMPSWFPRHRTPVQLTATLRAFADRGHG